MVRDLRSPDLIAHQTQFRAHFAARTRTIPKTRKLSNLQPCQHAACLGRGDDGLPGLGFRALLRVQQASDLEKARPNGSGMIRGYIDIDIDIDI